MDFTIGNRALPISNGVLTRKVGYNQRVIASPFGHGSRYVKIGVPMDPKICSRLVRNHPFLRLRYAIILTHNHLKMRMCPDKIRSHSKKETYVYIYICTCIHTYSSMIWFTSTPPSHQLNRLIIQAWRQRLFRLFETLSHVGSVPENMVPHSTQNGLKPHFPCKEMRMFLE